MTAARKPNDINFMKEYTDKIKTAVTDALKEGGFSHRK